MKDSKAALIKAMETCFNGDAKRISHARRVTEYAEELLKREGGDYTIIIGASILHDIGIHQAQKKYGSTAGKYQEKEGPPIARRLLTKLGFEKNQIEEICAIIACHHSPGKINTQNFKLLYDADWLVNLRNEHDIRDRDKLGNIIDKVFLTSNGKTLAREINLQDSDQPY